MKVFKYSFAVWILIIVLIAFFLNFPPLVKLFGENYISICENLQTEVISFLYEDVDVKPIDSSVKTEHGKVWSQSVLELNLPYNIEVSYVIEKLKKKFGFSFELLEEQANYRKYLVFYNDLPIQILNVFLEVPKVAIIFDDVGENIKQVKEILKLHIPVTVAILPFLNYSKESAVSARENDVEVMLHLPMEPYQANVTPGIHTITTEMSDNEIIKWTRESIQNIPYIRGLNNHMGSKATESKRVMRTVLGVAKYYNLYFIDSRTSSKSIGFKMAKMMEMPADMNHCYLDNKNNIKYIKKRLDLLIRMTLREGKTIAIGHSRYKTIRAIKDYIQKFKNKGIKFVCVSDIVK